MISVVIPAYNAEKTLDRCIESVRKSLFADLQIVVVDDGSTDSTGMIADRFSLIDSRIIVIHTKNNGSVAARKRGLEICTGEYVSFIDSDDYIEPQMYSEWIDSIDHLEVDVAYFGSINEVNGKIISTESINFNGFITFESEEEVFEYFLKNVLNENQNGKFSFDLFSKLYRRSLITKHFLRLSDNQQIGEDLLCNMYCLFDCKNVFIKSIPLYHYQVKNNSLSHTDKAGKIISGIGLCESVIDVMREYSLEKSMKNSIAEFVHCLLCERMKSNVFPQYIRIFEFDEVEKLRGKKVCIYGGGTVGQDYYNQLCHYKDIDVVSVLDLDSPKQYDYGLFTISPIDYRYDDADFVLVAVESERVKENIIDALEKVPGLENKIVWSKPKRIRGIK